MKLLQGMKWKPKDKKCLSCGSVAPPDALAFTLTDGRALCQNCLKIQLEEAKIKKLKESNG